MKLEKESDRQREAAIAAQLAAHWRCEWGQLGPYSPYDIYMHRQQKMVALTEIRDRPNRARDTWSMVFINLDKWFTLFQAEIGLGLPGMYAVAFTDGIFCVRIGTLPVNTYRLSSGRGRTDRGLGAVDQKPVIEIPSKMFRFVCREA